MSDVHIPETWKKQMTRPCFATRATGRTFSCCLPKSNWGQMVSKETDTAEHLYQEEKEAKLSWFGPCSRIIETAVSKVKKKKNTVLTGNHLYWSYRFLQQTPLRTQKLYVVFNFLVLAALMKPVTHLTTKERIYNPPVQMRHLNLSSNRLIFSTELKRRN